MDNSGCRRAAALERSPVQPCFAAAALMLRRRLFILGLLAVMAMIALNLHKNLQVYDPLHRAGKSNGKKMKHESARAESKVLLEQSPGAAAVAVARANMTRPAPATTNASAFLTTTTVPGQPAAMQRASLLNNANMSCYTSNGGHGDDGFGSQFHYLLAAIAIAHHAGVNFAWVPFYVLAHNANVTEMEEFAGAAHAFRHREAMGSFASHADLQPSLDAIRNFKNRPDCSRGNAPFMWYINAPKLVLDAHPGLWVAARDILRSVYFSTPKPDVSKYFTGGPGVKRVVLFQRRFIRAFDNRETFLPNEYYISIVKRLQIIHNRAHFYLLSLSNMKQPCAKGLCDEQFDDFIDIPNLTLLLDLPLTHSFHVMVSADILVDSQSSLSYAAAVLSLGEVYHFGGHHALVPGNALSFPFVFKMSCTSHCLSLSSFGRHAYDFVCPGWHECAWDKGSTWEQGKLRCSGLLNQPAASSSYSLPPSSSPPSSSQP